MHDRGFRHGDDVRLRLAKGRIPGRRDLSGDRNFGGRAFSADGAPAARGDSQAGARDWNQHGGQPAVGTLLRISRAGGRDPGKAAGGDGRTDTKVVATGGLAPLIGTGFEVHQAGGRVPDAGRAAHYLGAQCHGEAGEQAESCGSEAGCGSSGETSACRQATTFVPLILRGKLLQLLHRNRGALSARGVAAFCCSRRSTGR